MMRQSIGIVLGLTVLATAATWWNEQRSKVAESTQTPVLLQNQSAILSAQNSSEPQTGALTQASLRLVIAPAESDPFYPVEPAPLIMSPPMLAVEPAPIAPPAMTPPTLPKQARRVAIKPPSF
jgi:hypothetical protein